MPWTAKDSLKHHKGLDATHQRQWMHVANSVLKKTGDEARAIRAANSVVGKKSLQRKMKGK